MSQKIERLSDLPKYLENPFIDKAVSVIESNRGQKKQFMSGNRGVQQIVANVDTGEIVGQSVFAKVVEVDEDKFAKLYLSELALLWDLTKPALRVFTYILSILRPNDDRVFIDIEEALKHTNYASKESLFLGLRELVKAGIIARSERFYMYFVNPMFVFNGNRITFARTYVKKSKSKTIENPNQLNLFSESHHKEA